MVRHSLNYVTWKDKRAVAADLKTVYQAGAEVTAEHNLDEFAKKWDSKYPAISKSWYNNWETISTLFGYHENIRKALYDQRNRVIKYDSTQGNKNQAVISK
jgi:putative transposase